MTDLRRHNVSTTEGERVGIEEVAGNARRWMFNAALPLWGKKGRTKSGLFAERIDLGAKADDSYFRTFVQARHVYAFAEGGSLGWDGPWAELITETISSLLANARRNDGLFVHKMNVEGGQLDCRADLYDQAFVLFSLGKAGQALDRLELFDEAERIHRCLVNAWGLPDNGYFEGEIVDNSIRRQNPHMHLFEAFLCLYEGSRRAVFLDAAVQIAELCVDKFIDHQSGALLEYFDQELCPLEGQIGETVEPGHCFEWAWLFERLSNFGWSPAMPAADQLVSFARQYGICQRRGVAMNEVALDGSVITPSARLWPQTERLKAAVSRYRRLGIKSESDEIVLSALGLEKYFDVAVEGLWRDKLEFDGSWIEEMAPGSSLYHIVCAYGELLRV